jgi:TPR repeat protein
VAAGVLRARVAASALTPIAGDADARCRVMGSATCRRTPVKSHRLLPALRAIVVAVAAALTIVPAPGHGSGLDTIGVRDAPSRLLPGRYFEQKAQFYLRRRDYREALRLFELSAFWADKLAQYNVGIMYYNGIGIETDRSRGVAWLGIAAQNHDDLADAALQAAYASLGTAERQLAESIYRQLDARYGNAVAVPRALRQYQSDAAISLFGFGVTGPGYVQIAAGAEGAYQENSADFVRRMTAQHDALVAQISGRVTVGAVTALDVAAPVRRNASDTVLDRGARDHD